MSKRPRAVDLSTGVGAAYASKLLGEAGWDVVKVEPPGGDPLRTAASRWGGGEGGAFAFVNYGKRSVVVDRGRLSALVAAAAVAIGDFSAGGCAGSGLKREDFDDLQPRLAMVSLSPFGLRGPRTTWAASELIVQAASSLMFLTGEWDQPPMQLPPYAGALAGGLAAASAALAAVRSARRDGRVRRLDVSMVEALAAHTSSQTTRYVYRGEVTRREQRIKHALRMVPAADGFVYCAPGAVRAVNMVGVAKLIEEPRLAEERFRTAEGRMQNWEEFVELFVAPFATKTAQEWFEAAAALDLTFALVQTVDDLFACPQLAARELFREVPGPAGAPVRIPGRPFRLENGPAAASRPAPRVPGANTEEVLKEWLP